MPIHDHETKEAGLRSRRQPASSPAPEKSPASPQWKLSRIDICGFPAYVFGHSYLLLEGPGYSCLAHLKIEVPSEEKLSPCNYWPRFFCTNTLGATVATFTGDKVADQLAKISKMNCSVTRIDWTITEAVGQRLRKKIEDQASKKQPLPAFLLYGRNSCFDGENCMNWIDDLLAEANVINQEQQRRLRT